MTPQIFDSELFRISGHYENYRDNMYSPIEIEDVETTAKTLPGFVDLWTGMLG